MRKWLSVSLAILLLAFGVWAFVLRLVGDGTGGPGGEIVQRPDDPVVATSPDDASSPRMAAPAPAASPGAGPGRSEWKKFRARFGKGVRIEPGADGFAAVITGVPGAGTGAGKDYSSSDADKVRERALEVIEGARGVLGLQSQSPLGEPVVRPGAVSALAEFAQTVDGAPVAPFGKVTVVLGSKGELTSVNSDYVRDVRVSGERKLTQAEARASAMASTGDIGKPADEGRAVVWVSRGAEGGGAMGRRAYEYDVEGRQVVIDAETGQLIRRRDRRQF